MQLPRRLCVGRTAGSAPCACPHRRRCWQGDRHGAGLVTRPSPMAAAFLLDHMHASAACVCLCVPRSLAIRHVAMPFFLTLPAPDGAVRFKAPDGRRVHLQWPQPLPAWLDSRAKAARLPEQVFAAHKPETETPTSPMLLVEWAAGPVYEDVITVGWSEEADVLQEMFSERLTHLSHAWFEFGMSWSRVIRAVSLQRT